MIITQSFVSVDVGNRLEVMSDATVATMRLASANCACRMEAILTRETSELLVRDLWPANRMDGISNICCNCAVVLFHTLARIESEIKIFTLTMY